MTVREDVSVSLEGGSYTLTAMRRGSYRVFWSTEPCGFCDDNELGVLEETLTFPTPSPGRLYFHMVDGDYYTVAAERVIRAPRMSNMRELGGYNTADGESFVRHGMLLRSDAPCRLTEQGMSVLDSFGVGAVIDFRTPNERRGSEDPAVKGAKSVLLSPITDEVNAYAIDMSNLNERDLKYMKSISAGLDEVYSKIVTRSEFGEIFKLLARTERPMLFHCAAGKDRTGIQAVVLLLALGVPRDTAIYDYMLTNTVRAAHISDMVTLFTGRFGPEYRELVEAFFSVKREFIDGALEVIDAADGGFDGYLKSSLGVDGETLDRVKKLCLIKHKAHKGD